MAGSLTQSSGLTVKGVIGTTTKKPARWLFAWPRENQYCGIEFFVQHSTQIAFDLPTCTPKWIDLMSNERKTDWVLVIPFPMKLCSINRKGIANSKDDIPIWNHFLFNNKNKSCKKKENFQTTWVCWSLSISLSLSLPLREKSDAVEVDKTFLNSCLNLSPYK